MANNRRVRICDIAEELGVSTATVSNVIHGKTKKISDETVRRVQQLLEEREYIPSMAGILLAQNDSRIALSTLLSLQKQKGESMVKKLPVTLVQRESTAKYTKQSS